MRIAAIILAAGRSRRFGGENKLLALLAGTPVLTRTAKAVAGAGFDEIIAVAGPDHAAIEHALMGLPVRCVRCADEQDGMGYSIATGARELAADVDGVAIVPGDMPLLKAGTLRQLVGVFAAQSGRRIVHAADTAGEQRNPVIWPRAFIDDLRALSGEQGAKAMIRNATSVRVADRELIDVDDEAAFAEARHLLGS